MPIIGIPLKYNHTNEGVSILTISEYLRRSIQNSGGTILPIVPVQDVDYCNTEYDKFLDFTESEKNKIEEYLNVIDGIVFSGGNKETPYEMYLLKRCIEKDIPVLGICLGLQLMSCYPDGFNVEKIESNINHFQDNYDSLCHKIKIIKGTKLYDILLKEEIMVNSFHRYKANNNSNFNISAVSLDNNIEAIEMPNKKFILGVQWHPEISYSFDEDSRKVIEAFINACKK